MIKIAFVIDTIESPTAGTEKQLLLLIKHLDRSKFQPFLCALRNSEWLENEFDLCPLFVAGIYSFKSMRGLRGVLSLSQFFKKEKFDIVQAHFRDSSIAGIIAAKLAGIKTIIGTRRNQGYWLTPLEMKIQKGLDRWITKYISNSQSTRQWLNNNEGVDYKRIEVINNGFDLSVFPDDFSATRKQIRISLCIAESAPVVVIVANLRAVKDHVTFLKAAQIVHCHIPTTRFIVVGAGPELEKLEILSADLGIAPVVSFLGVRHDIPNVLAACDVGILSSVSESFSNAVVEYMAAGLPVITTDVGGARESVDDGVNGYIVPVGDSAKMGEKIIKLLESGRTAEMGQESRRRSSERFELMRMVDNTELLYTRCMDGAV